MPVTPQKKYYLYITLLTVVAMYVVVVYILPLLTAWLNSHNMSNRWLELVKFVLVFLGTIGVYTAFSQLLVNVLEYVLWLKKYIFGNEYLHGTWIGYFTINSNTKIFTVEHFTQSLDSLTIKGKGYIAKPFDS